MRKVQLKNKILILTVIGVFAGCGIKGNPVPYYDATDIKPRVNNMQAVSTADSVLLKWNLQDNSGLVKYINIERSTAGSIGNECRDCPRQFEKLGRMSNDDGALREKRKKMSFADKKAIKGEVYDYRLNLCDDKGNCSDWSTVEINYR